MALLRCDDHPPPTDHWTVAVKPVGYPETAVHCGVLNHDTPTPALVWLTPDEHFFYRRGKRVFTVNTTRIQVSDTRGQNDATS